MEYMYVMLEYRDTCNIWDSSSTVAEDPSFLGCDTVLLGVKFFIVQTIIVPVSSLIINSFISENVNCFKSSKFPLNLKFCLF
jgi:hypothetical protein